MFGAWVEHAWDVEMFHITMVEKKICSSDLLQLTAAVKRHNIIICRHFFVIITS